MLKKSYLTRDDLRQAIADEVDPPQTVTVNNWRLTQTSSLSVRVENVKNLRADTALRCDQFHRSAGMLRTYVVYWQPDIIPAYVKREVRKILNTND